MEENKKFKPKIDSQTDTQENKTRIKFGRTYIILTKNIDNSGTIMMMTKTRQTIGEDNVALWLEKMWQKFDWLRRINTTNVNRNHITLEHDDRTRIVVVDNMKLVLSTHDSDLIVNFSNRQLHTININEADKSRVLVILFKKHK